MAMTGGTSVLLKSSIPSGFGSHAVKLYAYYKYNQSTVENNTKMYCGMYVTTDTGWNIGEWTDHAGNGSYIGTTSNKFNGTMPNHSGTYWLTENQEFTVPHNSDGTGSATIYWKWNVNSPWGGFVYPSGYFNVTLPTIPRKATVTSAPDFTDLDNPTITFSNPGGFKMDVWLEPNPVGDHLCVREDIPNTGSYTWVLTDEERGQLRNKCYGKSSCKIRLGLYSYVNGVADASYADKTFTMALSDATKPAVDAEVSYDNNSLNKDHNRYKNLALYFIQGKTRLNVKISAEGKYGADITNYISSIDGKVYYSQEFTSDVITSSGDRIFSFGATDSRGFSGAFSRRIYVNPYSKPLVVPIDGSNAILCYRSDGNGVRVGNSTSVWIKAKMTFYSVEGANACALQWRRKVASADWDDSEHLWKDLKHETTKTDSLYTEYNALLSGEVFQKGMSYTVQIRAIDAVGEQDIKTFEIPTEDVALHLGKGGKNVSVGTYCDYSEERTFYSDWKAIFDKDVIVGGNILIGENKTSLRDYILNIMNGG